MICKGIYIDMQENFAKKIKERKLIRVTGATGKEKWGDTFPWIFETPKFPICHN